MYSTEAYRANIAERLKEARMAAGITVTEVAEALGKNKNTVYGWELGRIQPTADTFLQLMMLYGISDFNFFALDSSRKHDYEYRNHPAYTTDEARNEFLSLLNNADSQIIKAVKALLQALQEK